MFIWWDRSVSGKANGRDRLLDPGDFLRREPHRQRAEVQGAADQHFVVPVAVEVAGVEQRDSASRAA
jgi:hypothetical protein